MSPVPKRKSEERRLCWNGSEASISEEDIRKVVHGLGPESRERLRQIAEGRGTDEVAVVIWLHESSHAGERVAERTTKTRN